MSFFYIFYVFLSLSISIKMVANPMPQDSLAKLVTEAGRAYQKLDTKKSLQFAQKALNYAYENDDQVMLARIYNIIGLNYTEYGEYKKAEEAFLNGLQAIEKKEDIKVKSWLETNIANLYQVYFKNYDLAISYHLRSLENSKQLNSEYDVLLSIINLSILYFDKLEYEQGNNYLKEAEKYLFKINEPEIFISYNSLKAIYATHKNDLKGAENFYLEALKYCETDLKKISLSSAHEMELYDDISRFYEKMGDSAKSYKFLLKHVTLKDSLYSKEKTDAMINLSNQIDLDLYKRQIGEIEKINEQQNKIIFYSKIVAVLFAIIILNLFFSIYFLKRSQKQKNRLIKAIESKNIELEAARTKAEELSELKGQFISNVSHELRTPLYGVIGLAKILEQDFPEFKSSKILQSLNFSADYLMNLINDLLEIQKIETNGTRIDNESYHIISEVNNIVNTLTIFAQKNNNYVSIEIGDFVSDMIEVDKLKLNRILYNLISNALKFTTNGNVNIKISQKAVSKNNIKLTYQIKDTGIGISEENIEFIFDKFSQFHSKGSDYQGTGLGLPIVKQLVHVLGGDLNVFSELGAGTIFTFTIPVKITSTTFKDHKTPINSELQNTNLKVLLVENNEVNRIVSQHVFNKNNISCTIVSTAKEALDILDHETFSVILTDINMAEMDGFELARQIRSKNINTPIIALTAYSKNDIEKELLNNDIQDVVTKPYELEYLLKVIYKNL